MFFLVDLTIGCHQDPPWCWLDYTRLACQNQTKTNTSLYTTTCRKQLRFGVKIPQSELALNLWLPPSILYSSHDFYDILWRYSVDIMTHWSHSWLRYRSEFNCSDEREEVPQWGFTALFTMSLILHRGIIPNHPVSGGNEAFSTRGQGVTCFLWNLIIISAASPALNIVRHEGQLSPG